MKKIILILCMLFVVSASQAQLPNLIYNSSNWVCSNGSGVADSWYTGPFVNVASVDSGCQFVASNALGCKQVCVGQVTAIPNAYQKEFTLEFDICPSQLVWVLAKNKASEGYVISTVISDTTAHYKLPFTCLSDSLYGIEFITTAGTDAWLRLDNVVLTSEMFTGVDPVKITAAENSKYPTYILNMRGQRIKEIPDIRGLYLIVQGSSVKKVLK